MVLEVESGNKISLKHDELNELLSLYVVSKQNLPYRIKSVHSDIVNFAVEEVMEGSSSDALLILASLSIDKRIDTEEIELYFKRFLSETGMKLPSIGCSVLTWLSLEIRIILNSRVRLDIENRLSKFALYWYDSPCRIAGDVINFLHNAYFWFTEDPYYCDARPVSIDDLKSKLEDIFKFISNQEKREWFGR